MKKQPKRTSFKHIIQRLLHSVLLAVNVGVVLLLLLSGNAFSLNPTQSPVLSLLCYAFPFVALANLVFLVYWVLRFKWWVLISLVGLVLTIGTHKAWFPINVTGEDQPTENSMKILTLNVMNFDYPYNTNQHALHPVIEYIANSGADIVCLQEVGESFVRKRLKNKETQVALKAYRYVMTGASEGKYSVVCLSKYPVIEKHRIKYKSLSNSSYRYDFLVNNDTLTVINNHLESNKLNSKEKDHYTNLITNRESEDLPKVAEILGSKVGSATSIRAEQANAVAEEISTCTNPVIVCGDFNDVPGSYVYRTISKGLSDAWVKKGLGWGNTFHESLFLFRIDYLLHSPSIKTLDVTRDKVKISDHYPLMATLRL